jgi:hypothetical protein
VFNATFSNISAMSWRPVLVVEEAGFVYNYCDLFVYYSLYCLCERQNMSKIRVDIKLNTSQQVATINIDYLTIDDDDDIYIYIFKSQMKSVCWYI